MPALWYSALGRRRRVGVTATAVLAGEIVPRSRAHVGYVVAEAVKVVALLVTGVLALSSL